MKTKSIIFSLLVMLTSVAGAQDYLFKVMATKGNVQVKKGGSWSALGSGSKVYKGSEVKIAPGSYLSLVHLTGKSLEVKETGTYKAEDLAAKFNKKSGGFASKYANYVLSEVDDSGGTSDANTTGMVERKISKDIEIYAKMKGNVLLKDIPSVVKWDYNEQQIDEPEFVLSLMTFEEEVVYTKEVNGTSTVLDLRNLELEEDNYFVVVKAKNATGTKSEKYLMHIKSGDEAKNILSEIEELNAELDGSSALDNFIKARYYQEKELYLNAVEELEEAHKKQPEVQDYTNLYARSLNSYGVYPNNIDLQVLDADK